MMGLLTQVFEHVDHREVNEHEDEHGDNLIHNKILDRYVQTEESSGGPIKDYKSDAEVKTLMEVASRHPLKLLRYVPSRELQRKRLITY